MTTAAIACDAEQMKQPPVGEARRLIRDVGDRPKIKKIAAFGSAHRVIQSGLDDV